MSLTRKIAYLKHVGKLQNVKVSLEFVDGKMFINVHDMQFTSFKTALDYLKRDAEMIAAPVNVSNEVK